MIESDGAGIEIGSRYRDVQLCAEDVHLRHLAEIEMEPAARDRIHRGVSTHALDGCVEGADLETFRARVPQENVLRCTYRRVNVIGHEGVRGHVDDASVAHADPLLNSDSYGPR